MSNSKFKRFILAINGCISKLLALSKSGLNRLSPFVIEKFIHFIAFIWLLFFSDSDLTITALDEKALFERVSTHADDPDIVSLHQAVTPQSSSSSSSLNHSLQYHVFIHMSDKFQRSCEEAFNISWSKFHNQFGFCNAYVVRCIQAVKHFQQDSPLLSGQVKCILDSVNRIRIVHAALVESFEEALQNRNSFIIILQNLQNCSKEVLELIQTKFNIKLLELAASSVSLGDKAAQQRDELAKNLTHLQAEIVSKMTDAGTSTSANHQMANFFACDVTQKKAVRKENEEDNQADNNNADDADDECIEYLEEHSDEQLIDDEFLETSDNVDVEY